MKLSELQEQHEKKAILGREKIQTEFLDSIVYNNQLYTVSQNQC